MAALAAEGESHDEAVARTVLRPALGGIVATLLWWGCDPRPALALALGLALLTLYLLVIYPLSCSALRSR